MSDEAPIFTLNAMMLTYDSFYLIRDVDVAGSTDLEEYVKSGGWTHDAAKQGWTSPRTPLYTVV